MMRKLIYLFWVPLSFALSVDVMSDQINERDMKAALIYNFAVFTTWPLISGDTFNICVFDEDRENINHHLLKSRKISGKQINFMAIYNIDAVNDCQVLYLEEKKIKSGSLSRILVNRSILSIVDVTENTANSGIINIQLVNNKFNFTINNEAAKYSNLILSSKLLRLATEVY